MTEGRRLRFLLVAVAGVSLLLLLAARWAGRLAGSDVAARHAQGGAAARADAAAGTPDLSFYRTLGAAPAPGRKGGSAPSEPVLRPAPGDAVPSGSAYVVQALATRDERQAKRLRDRLAGRGLPATIVQDDSGELTVYRVRIGRWKERASAETVAARLREQDGLEPWVLQDTLP